MKRLALLAFTLAFAAVPGCSTTPKPKSEARPASDAAPAPTPEEQERAKKAEETVRRLAGVAEPVPSDKKEEPWIIITDEATGKQLQRIPKNPTLRSDGKKLRHTLLNPSMFSLDLVREDDKYYYVDAPPDGASKPRAQAEKAPQDLAPIIEVPPAEYEVVTPKVSASRLRFEEKSEGLPTSGFWRTNMEVADLDGDGSLEIVTPPPRLASSQFRVFRWTGDGWTPVQVQVESSEPGLRFAYGGVAVADIDGDGKPDILGIGHGAGPVVAFNLGGGRFRIESRGMPKEMTGRALAAGDVDGDGRMDVVAISDEPESSRATVDRERARNYHLPPGKAAGPGEYVKGFDMRAFFGRPDGTFQESTQGLETACFGYTLALSAKPADGGAPYFVTGCRYQGGRALLYEWDAAAKSFRHVGRGVVEEFSFHSGSAVGTYHGFPAAFASYVKGNAPGAVEKPIRGHGLDVYYRDGNGWKSKRIVEVLGDIGDESQGVGAGDLNGDGLDDVVWADDSVGRVRVFFQTAAGEFEELDPALEPRFVNHSMSVRVVDVDGDGRKDVVLMYEFRTTDRTRAGGLRFFRNLG